MVLTGQSNLPDLKFHVRGNGTKTTNNISTYWQNIPDPTMPTPTNKGEGVVATEREQKHVLLCTFLNVMHCHRVSCNRGAEKPMHKAYNIGEGQHDKIMSGADPDPVPDTIRSRDKRAKPNERASTM